MRAAHQEIVLIREALEGLMAPEVATALLFDALAQTGEPPRSLHEARSFVSGPLTSVMSRRVRPDDVTSILRLMHGAIDAAIDRDGVDVDVEIDSLASASGEGSTETQQMSTIARPVPVVVLAASASFSERLGLCLGEDRVYCSTVATAAALRKALFAQFPMLVVIDASSVGEVDADSVAEVVRGFPDGVVPVLWAGETPWGERLLSLAPRTASARNVVTLDRKEGIEPLCDLVLSRFRGA
ncbi:MAG: hypothetical protein J0L92_30500 [Deltaproteobacteria bacterium]|nr:hypothetical protein [Deltaproteobacteria bacterium]